MSVEQTLTGSIRHRLGAFGFRAVSSVLILQVQVREHGTHTDFEPVGDYCTRNVDRTFWRDAKVEDFQLLRLDEAVKAG